MTRLAKLASSATLMLLLGPFSASANSFPDPFDFGSQFGARIEFFGADGTPANSFDFGRGGDSTLRAFDDSHLPSPGTFCVGGCAFGAAFADASQHTAGAQASGTGPFFGKSLAELYDVFTIVGPPNVTPVFSLNFNLHGSGSGDGTSNPTASFGLSFSGLGASRTPIMGDIVVGSTGAFSTDLSGTVVFDQDFQSNQLDIVRFLTTGDSFIISASLRVQAVTGTSADFFNTSSFSLTSDDPRVSLVSSAASQVSPVPEPASLLLLASGLMGVAIHRLRRSVGDRKAMIRPVSLPKIPSAL